MDVLNIISVGLSFLLSVLGWFMKETLSNIKEDNKNLWRSLEKQKEEVDKIKDTYIKKEDFREFKEELFIRLDRMDADFKQQLTNLTRN